MNVKHVAIALSLLASATAAMAVEATQWNPPAGQLARTEVKTELARAAANGDLDARGEAYAGYIDRTAPKSTLARTDVKEELARARVNGELEGRNEAYSGVTAAHPHVAARTFAWRLPHRAAKSPAQGSGE